MAEITVTDPPEGATTLRAFVQYDDAAGTTLEFDEVEEAL